MRRKELICLLSDVADMAVECTITLAGQNALDAKRQEISVGRNFCSLNFLLFTFQNILQKFLLANHIQHHQFNDRVIVTSIQVS